MGQTCGTCGENEERMGGFGGKPKEREYLQDTA